MKLKYYLRGLGVGIICTAIIMGIALSGKEKEKLTNAEIVERARLLGMVMEEETEEPKQSEESQESEKDNPDNSKEETQNNQDNPENPENQIPQVESQEPVAPEAPAEQPVAEPEIKTIEVLPGEYSDIVSQKLFEAGLISDANAFNKYLMDSGQDQNIMVGVHQIPMGVSEDEIIKILGEKPE